MTALRWGSATDVGRVRRNNQDNLVVTGTLFAVADGMGGHVGGEVASKIAVEALQEGFGGAGDARTADDLIAAVQRANAGVYERAQSDPELRGMGTTLTAAALVVEDGEERIAIANVGDSRAYVFSQNELTQLTEDHSVAEELVRQGQLDPSEVDTHPQRHILTRAMGIAPDVSVDVWEVLPYTGDRILLCSDGLVRELSDDQIAAALRRLADPTEASRDLVARARAAGGSDNITVVIVDVVDDEGLAEAASAAVTPELESHLPPESGNTTAAPPAAFSTPTAAPPARKRRLTLRVVAFVVLLIVVLAAAAGAIGLYARGSYFVTIGPDVPGGHQYQYLAVYKGRPGGVLWFKPSLVEVSSVNTAEVLAVHAQDLKGGHIVSSRAAADTYIKGLFNEAVATATSTTVTTTSTVVPSTTTTSGAAPPTSAGP